MQSLAIHPALWQLLRIQARGKLRRLRASFASPRRQFLSVLAVVLAVVWLGNAVAGVLLRDAYDPAVFQRWMSRSLLLYFVWHLVRVAYSRPESALEWSPSEEVWLCGGPFSRRELFTYRLLGIFSATLPKAALVTFVLFPDLPLIWSGFCGLLLGLVFLEYFRLMLETLICGISHRWYTGFRVVVFASMIGIVGSALWQTVSLRELNGENHWPFLREWGRALAASNDSWIGQVVEAPFRMFANVIVAEELSASFVAAFGGTVFLVVAAAHFAIRLDDVFYEKSREAELGKTESEAAKKPVASRWPRIFRLRGAGPIAWRQLHFARRHWTSLSVGLGVPALLACLPLLVPGEGAATFLTVFGGVVFYSFVLLPAALKLDFRRDYDHLALLKTLPVHPLAVVVGQLATPVLLTWLFQIGLLTLAALVCSVSWDLAVGCIVFLLPVSIFFTALDNLIFLLYPHRLHQEGFEVFLRSTLTFTGKGMLLVGALLGVLGWLRVSRYLTASWGPTEAFRAIFVTGVGSFIVGLALCAVFVSAWTYNRLDPTEL